MSRHCNKGQNQNGMQYPRYRMEKKYPYTIIIYR